MPENMPQPGTPRTAAVLLNLRSGREYPLADTTTLGRLRKCDITVSADKVSRYHARVIQSPKGFVLEDLESRNGTYLDSRRVQEAIPLHDGARILIGDTVFAFFERSSLPGRDDPSAVVMDNSYAPEIKHSLAAEQQGFLEEALTAASPEDMHRFQMHVGILRDMMQQLKSLHTVESIVHEFTKRFLHLFAWADCCVVVLRKGPELEIRSVHRRSPDAPEPIRISHSRLSRVITAGCGLVLEAEDWHKNGVDIDKESDDFAFRVALCVPLLMPERAIGAVYTEALSTKGRFTEQDLRLAVEAAGEVASLIETVRLYEQTRREKDHLREENLRLRDRLRHTHHFGKIIGVSDAIHQAVAAAEDAAGRNRNVLLCGEPGTGKRLFAELIHHNSSRASARLSSVGCEVTPPDTLERILFGQDRPQGDDATRQLSLIELADRGILLLDGIDAMPQAAQARLLDCVQSGKIVRTDKGEPSILDVRAIATTRADPEEEDQGGGPLEDLLHRLQFVTIQLPPLRERPEDVVALAQHFHAMFCGEMGKRVPDLDDDAMAVLGAHAWPGNVRELRNLIERAIMVAAPDASIPASDVQRMIAAP